MMNQLKVGKSESGPSTHLRFDFIDGVPPEARQHSAQHIPALPPIYFGGAANVKVRAFFKKYTVADAIVNGTAANAEARIFAKVFKTFLKVVAREGKVSIKIYKKFPVARAQQFDTQKKPFDAAAGRTKAAIFATSQTNPGILSGIAF